jgi:hypothetical protein
MVELRIEVRVPILERRLPGGKVLSGSDAGRARSRFRTVDPRTLRPYLLLRVREMGSPHPSQRPQIAKNEEWS